MAKVPAIVPVSDLRPADLLTGLCPIAVPDWLRDYLSRGQQTAALVSEKARSEFLVVPILMAARELTTAELSIYSGQRLDVIAIARSVDRTGPVPRPPGSISTRNSPHPPDSRCRERS